MNISRQQMDHAVRQIQQGLMRPDEAARWLLGEPSMFHRANDGNGAATMTVADLQAMLGPAPREIQRDWDRQLATISADFEACQGRPMPDLTTDDLWVDADNCLSLASHILEETACQVSLPDTTGPFSETTASRHRLEIFQPLPSSTAPRGQRPKPSRYLRPRIIAKRQAIAVAILLCAVLAMAVAFDRWTSFRENAGATSFAVHDQVTAADPSARVLNSELAVTSPAARSSSIFSPAALPESPPNQVTPMPPRSKFLPTSPPAQQAIATLSPEESNAADPAVGVTAQDGQWLSTSDWLSPTDFEVDARSLRTSAVIDIPEPPDLPQSNTIANDPVEAGNVDYPTSESSRATGFALPPVPSRDVLPLLPPVIVVSKSIADLALSFPSDVGLRLLQTDARWIVQTTNTGEALATFSLGNEGLAFQWNAMAASHPLAKQLAWGALAYTLHDGSQRSLFLRPELSAAACPIDLANTETTIAWPIEIAPPAAFSTLTLQCELPAEVRQTWVQPHDPKQHRKSQSICEFSLGKDPTVAIRSRIELRTGTRVTLRMRHAARVDTNFNWQWISGPQLSAAHDQVTEQLAASLAEQSRLKSIYAHASTADRKTIGMQRETVDLLVSRLQRLNARLDQFQQLFDLLDGNAYLNVCLSVHWQQATPPLVQTILATAVPAGDTP